MLARKQAMHTTKQSGAAMAMERSRLLQARTLALRRNELDEVAEIDVRLGELAPVREAQREDSSSDVLMRLNERNRKANQEAVRKAERAELDRKRRERQLRAGTATPTLSDAASRLKAKMAGSRSVSSSCSRDVCACVSGSLTILVHLLGPPTPYGGDYVVCRLGTPGTPAAAEGDAASPRSVSPSGATQTKSGLSFEASLVQSVEIDLGDF